jgi:hypothetical protein
MMDRVRGLGDTKSSDPVFDDAWLCAGEPSGPLSSHIAHASGASLRHVPFQWTTTSASTATLRPCGQLEP